MTASDSQGHNYSKYNEIEPDRILEEILKDLLERAKAGEESNRLYQSEYANSVLGKGFDPYVKSTSEVNIDGLEIVLYFPVDTIKSLTGLMNLVQPEEVKDHYLDAITQAELSREFTKEISTERKSRIEELLSTIKSYDVEILDSYTKENESDRLTKDTEIIGNVYELSNLLKDPKQITADYARMVVDTFVDFAGKMQTLYCSSQPPYITIPDLSISDSPGSTIDIDGKKEFSICFKELKPDTSDMIVTPPKIPEGYWK